MSAKSESQLDEQSSSPSPAFKTIEKRGLLELGKDTNGNRNMIFERPPSASTVTGVQKVRKVRTNARGSQLARNRRSSSSTRTPDTRIPVTANDRSVRVDNEDTIRQFYYLKFQQMQQIPCKHIAKAWVRVIHPKKQGKFPYNGGKKARALGIIEDAGRVTAPGWWPPLNHCRHREPDHIKRMGMLHLHSNGTSR